VLRRGPPSSSSSVSAFSVLHDGLDWVVRTAQALLAVEGGDFMQRPCTLGFSVTGHSQLLIADIVAERAISELGSLSALALRW
jgi:hypothetical protein